jgi:peptidoglycan/xylan/chitin deacetylase (PgdA/CDA1 family)
MFHPRSSLLAPVVYRGPGTDPARIALTFDDGPSADGTARVLDMLGELGVKAAFFVIGRNAQQALDLVRRADAEGQLVASHSHDHHRLGLFGGREYWHRQLESTDALIEQALGKRPALFRPPMGFKHVPLATAARARGQTIVTWTRRAFDCFRCSSEAIVARLAPHARAGDIMVLHDGCEPGARRSARGTARALGPLVRILRDRGLEPVRLDALLGVEPYLAPSPRHSDRNSIRAAT